MDSKHIVTRFDKDLDRITARILQMGEMVADQIREATLALDRFDPDEVDRLIANDRKSNGMHKDIHIRAEQLIAKRQPMALDLRQALTPITIAAELERIGDHAKGTAKRARKLAGSGAGPKAQAAIARMSALVQAMLADALRAYEASDIVLAGEVRARDLEVDTLNKEVFASSMAEIETDPTQAAAHVHLVLLARGFERAGDHVVNIARHVHQIVTGEDLKAAEEPEDL